MKGNLLVHPVIFNVITIVAILLALFQVWGVTSTRTTDGIQLLERLAAEGLVEDATIASDLAADQEQYAGLIRVVIGMMVIAILANVGANYLGRGRHQANTARILELEAEVRRLRGR